MARINIEDCWWTDPRRERLTDLIGGALLADGAAIRMWRLAQEFWRHGRGLVPAHIFASLPHSTELVTSGLARSDKANVYVCGSSQYLDWIHDRTKAGQAGGRKSAKRPRDSKGRLTASQANTKQDPSTIQAESNQCLDETSKQTPSTGPSKSKQLQASPSSSPSKDNKKSLLHYVERGDSETSKAGLSPSTEEAIAEGQRKLQQLRSKQGITPGWPGGKL